MDWSRRLLLAAALGVCGCGLAGQLEPLGLGTVEAPFAVAPPAPPLAPAAPSWRPCTNGWVEVDAGVPACAPWPDDRPASCGAAEAHFPGEPGCTTVGRPCPAGEWPESLPSGRPVLFVSANAATNGDGTRAAPFNSVRAAFTAATPGTVIALGKGTHGVEDLVPAGVALIGACAASTTITRAATATRRVELYVQSAGVEVSDVRVQGAGVGLQVEGAGATVTVTGVLFDGAAGYAVSAVRGGRATLRDVAIRNTAPLSSVEGRGFEVALAGVVEARRVVIDGCAEVGVHVAGAGSRVVLEDAAVLHSGSATTTFGHGVRVETGASAQLSRTIVSGSRNEGVSVMQGADVALTDVVVRDTLPVNANGRFGDGLAVTDSTATGARVRLEHNSHAGLMAAGSTVTLDDGVFLDTQVDQLNLGLGVLARGGSQVSLTRGYVGRCRGLGVAATDPGTRLTVRDFTIEDTDLVPATATQSQAGGAGVGVRDSADLVLERVAVRRAQSFGVEVAGPVGAVSLGDVEVTATREGFDQGGLGVAVFDAPVTMTRVAVRDSVAVGLHLQGDTRATVQDVSVEGTRAASTGEAGASAVVTLGARLDGTRVTLRGGSLAGLLVNGAGSSVAVSEALVTGVRLACSGAACNGALAQGVAALESAALRLTRFRVSDTEGVGVLQATGGGVDLAHGEVSFHLVGAVTMDASFDAARLSDDVAYVHNQQKLSAQSVPLPKVPQFTPR